MSARIIMSVVAAECGVGMNDLLSVRRASASPRYTAALLMERLLGLVPKQIDHEFGRKDFAYHALKAARRRLADDQIAQARFNELERLCLAALAAARKEQAA